MEEKVSKTKRVQNEILVKISQRLQPNQWQLLGMALSLDMNDLLKLQKDADLRHIGFEAMVIQMLEKWKQKMNPSENELVQSLAVALNAIERKDIASDITNSIQPTDQYELNYYQQQIQEKQEKLFSNLELPRSLWLGKKWYPLEELFVELTMKKKNNWREEEIDLKDQTEIFYEVDDRKPLRILIEGYPGYGKTTLVTKLLSDWSRREKYIRDKFDLVFVIPLRIYEGRLESLLLQHCEGVEASEERKLEAIEAIQGRVLLLLDGLDEINQGLKDSLLPLLKGDRYPKMVVVVTCRTGHLQLEIKPNKILEFMKNKRFEKYSMWDKRIEIKGISRERRFEFLRKYLNCGYEELMEKLFKCNLNFSTLYECPLFLLLLAILIQEKNVESIRTITELYKAIVNFVINRSLNREELLEESKEFDVFDMKVKDNYDCRNLLIKFGRLCMNKIKNENLIFEEKELKECSDGDETILKLGFLSKQISFFNYEEKEFYEPIHRSFLEFSAAFYMSSLDESALQKEIEELCLKFNIWPRESQFIYSFLGGFLKSNAFNLFNALSPFKAIISVFNDYLCRVENILLEIPATEEIVKSLGNLMDNKWEHVEYSEIFRSWYVGILKYLQVQGLSEKISLAVPQYLGVLRNLSENVYVKLIHLDLNKFESKRHQLNFEIKSIQCQQLIIKSNGMSSEFPLLLKDILSKIKPENIWLKITHSNSNIEEQKNNFINWYREIIEGGLRQINLYFLSLEIPLYLFQLISSYLEDLVQRKKIVYGLRMHVTDVKCDTNTEKDLNSFLNFILYSDLKSINLDGEVKTITFRLNNPKKNKDWEYINLEGKLKWSTNEEMNFIYIKHYSCTYTVFDEYFLLKFRNVQRLTCADSLILNISGCYTISKWEAFQTILRLDIILAWDKVQNKNSFFQGLSAFQNIQHLHLVFTSKVDFPFKLLFIPPSLKKISLVQFFSSFSLELFEALFTINDNTEAKGLNLQEIEVQAYYWNEISKEDFLQYLERAFLKDIFRKFTITNTHAMDVQYILHNFISKSDYVVYSEWTEDSHYNDYFYINQDLIQEPNYRLTVMKK